MTFSGQDAEGLLSTLAAAGEHKLILIGGQAVNFWAEAFRKVEPALEAGPFASKDFDFLGDVATVERCARALHVQAQTGATDNHTRLRGRILYTLDGRECFIDFLDESVPNTWEDVERNAVPIKRPWGTLWVMHPFMCMRSRVFNVVQIAEKYDTEHGRRQLAASIVCVRRYAIDLVERQGEPVREALRIFSRVFEYCMHDENATRAARMGFDPFEVVTAAHPVLPANFEQKCLPRWRSALEKRRRTQT